MKCKCDLERAHFGADLYCEECCMDIGINHVTITRKGLKEYIAAGSVQIYEN